MGNIKLGVEVADTNLVGLSYRHWPFIIVWHNSGYRKLFWLCIYIYIFRAACRIRVGLYTLIKNIDYS